MLESPTIRKRVFEGVQVHGITKFRRFANLILDSYGNLVFHVKRYLESIGELIESREMIEEEIRLFYRKHDLGTIMGFLRSLDAPGADYRSLDNGAVVGSVENMEKKMRVHPPKPIEMVLPIVGQLKELNKVKKELKKLAKKAYDIQKQEL